MIFLCLLKLPGGKVHVQHLAEAAKQMGDEDNQWPAFAATKTSIEIQT